MNKYLGLLLIILAATSAAFADLAPPPTPEKNTKKSKSVESSLMIRLDSNADEPVLKISKSQLQNLRAQIDGIDAADSFASNGGTMQTQTIVGGMFLSLAFVFGGILFMRKQTSDNIRKSIAAGAILFLFGTTAAFVFANVGPPAQLRQISGKLFDKKVFGYWKRANGAIRIEVVEDGRNVELIVPDKEEKNKDGE